MDDLAGLDWSAPSKQNSTSTPKPSLPPFSQGPAPQLSGRSTPLSAQQSGAAASSNSQRVFKAPSKPATPANDSFAGLLSRNTTKPATSNLSLQERQKQLEEEKLKQERERSRQYEAQFGASDSKFWDDLGSGKNTPEPASTGLNRPAVNQSGDHNLSRTINKPFSGLDTSSRRPIQSPSGEDDILAAFNSAAPVDSSTHFPPPAVGSGRSTPAYSAPTSKGPTPVPQSSGNAFPDDEDDMFGLSQLTQKPAPSAPPPEPSGAADDDDILGLLGKPVSEFERKVEPAPVIEKRPTEAFRQPSPRVTSAHDKAVAELVDMGFPADRSAIALATTESGHDVQAAVGWILNEAHAEAKQKKQKRGSSGSRSSPNKLEDRSRREHNRPNIRRTHSGESVPAWMRNDEGRSRSGQRKQDSQAQEKDVSQYAQEIGSTLFKSANSFWKTSQKKVQKAVADFQQEGDPNVPKWMREAQAADEELQTKRSRRPGPDPSVTDEAMMLEGGGRPDKPSRPSENRHDPEPLPVRQRREQDGHHGYPSRMSSQSPAQRQSTSSLDKRPATRLTREDVEQSTAQAYVSPARRKKTTPQPNLLSSENTKTDSSSTSSRQPIPAQSNNPFLQVSSTPKTKSPAVTPPPPRTKAPPRQVPPISSSALSSSASHRSQGSEAFKRGDYSAAHVAYSSALSPLPSTHPVTIIVLCNRAVTNIKVGDPKAAVADADAALAIIGPSKGEGEKITPGGLENEKDMKEFFGKALMRKAEALEHMEKWADAGKVWREAVEAGVGGSISIQGRNRCEKAAGGGNSTTAARRAPVRKTPVSRPSAMSDLGGGPPAADSAAVKKLKAANAAAEKADDEKFALTDQVDAKLLEWKGTKADNLRALLGSLDKVLWPEAGWKKVNMGDLVMPNKVKIVYMKAIAKVHPDKISQTATTEQRMISAAVFATLNEAWDKFKKDNNL